VLAWIVIGGIFMGAVHDFSSIVVSVRHEGRGLGSVLEERLGRGMKTLFLLFVFFALILVIAVFANAVAQTFVSVPETATASMLFIFLAVGFGFSIYRFQAPFALATIAGVALLAACMILGYFFPFAPFLSDVARTSDCLYFHLRPPRGCNTFCSPVIFSVLHSVCHAGGARRRHHRAIRSCA
jgi:carbon starvation protein CstA